MLLQLRIGSRIFSFPDELPEFFHLALEPGRKDRQSHDFDQSDVFFFNMMQLGMGMVHPERMLTGGDIVAQDQVQLIIFSTLSGDGRDGVMIFSLRPGKDESLLIRITAPAPEDPVSQVDQALLIRSADADDRHGPFDDPGADILISFKHKRCLHPRLGHGELISAALEMLVAQDRPAHDRQIRIGTHHIMGELAHKIEQFPECAAVDLHRYMLPVENDAVLIVVNIGRILHVPAAAVHIHGDDPVVLPCRMIDPARIPHVLTAEQAFGIGGGFGKPCRGDRLRVLLRFREVDRDIEKPVLCGSCPLHILLNAVAPDIVRILRQPVIPVCRLTRVFPVKAEELRDHL